MARYDLRILSTLDPEWESRQLRVVTFPAPPTIAKGVMYAEDCWRSDVIDRGLDIVPGAIAGAFTDRGPAFLIEKSLKSLFSTNQNSVQTFQGIFCATISFATLFETSKALYVTEAILERVSGISSSCHPGSHTSVPLAPNLTALLQLNRALDGREVSPGFTYADHLVTSRYFPGHDFSGNIPIDMLFSYLTLSECLDRSVDSIVLPATLSPGLRSLVSTTLSTNDRLAQVSPDPIRRIDIIDEFRRRELVRHE